MEPPAVTRGRLTTTRTAESRTFMFNPPTLGDGKGVNYGTVTPAGATTPIYQYGSGGERIISFTLFFDGDRGRVGRGINDVDTPTLDISNELNWYKSLLYPDQFDRTTFVGVYPQTVLFTLGAYERGLECIVALANVNVTYWTPEMEPVRATVQIQLKEQPRRSRVASDIRGVRFPVRFA